MDLSVTASGSVLTDSGSVFTDSGSVFIDSGSVFIDSGSVFIDSGSVFIDSGSVFMDSGSVFIDSGSVFIDSGSVFMDSGSVFTDSGRLLRVTGRRRDARRASRRDASAPTNARTQKKGWQRLLPPQNALPRESLLLGRDRGRVVGLHVDQRCRGEDVRSLQHGDCRIAPIDVG